MLAAVDRTSGAPLWQLRGGSVFRSELTLRFSVAAARSAVLSNHQACRVHIVHEMGRSARSSSGLLIPRAPCTRSENASTSSGRLIARSTRHLRRPYISRLIVSGSSGWSSSYLWRNTSKPFARTRDFGDLGMCQWTSGGLLPLVPLSRHPPPDLRARFTQDACGATCGRTAGARNSAQRSTACQAPNRWTSEHLAPSTAQATGRRVLILTKTGRRPGRGHRVGLPQTPCTAVILVFFVNFSKPISRKRVGGHEATLFACISTGRTRRER